MSSQAAAEYVEVVGDQQRAGYIVMSAASMVVFNHLVTLHEEAAQFKRPKLSGAFMIYMANRYFVLAHNVLTAPLWSVGQSHYAECVGKTITVRTLSLAAYLPPAAFSGLRTWALLRSMPVAIIIFILSLSPFVMNAVVLHWSTVDLEPVYGCGLSQDVPPQLSIIFSILSRLPLIVAEIAVIVITWCTQYSSHRQAQAVLCGRVSLMTILLRDGTIYFGTLTSMHILHMTFSCLAILSSVPNYPETASYLSAFVNPLTNILVSTFLDDLRKAAEARVHDVSLSTRGSLEIRFVDSIAHPLPAPTEYPVNPSDSWELDETDGREAGSSFDP